MPLLKSCPACGQAGTLIALGVRRDRAQRWRPWVSTLTHVHLCASCTAIVTTGPAGVLSVDAVSTADSGEEVNRGQTRSGDGRASLHAVLTVRVPAAQAA